MAKNKGGRPTSMTKDTLKKLEHAFKIGATDEQACFYAGISHQTLYTYQKNTEGFLEQKTNWKNHLQFQAKNTLAMSIQEGSAENAKWLLERKEKSTYSTRSELTGADGDDLAIKLTKEVHSARDNGQDS